MLFPNAARASAILAALIIPACGGDGGGGDSSSSQATDFHLVDQNPDSTSYLASISPRDFQGHTAAFDFTHAN